MYNILRPKHKLQIILIYDIIYDISLAQLNVATTCSSVKFIDNRRFNSNDDCIKHQYY